MPDDKDSARSMLARAAAHESWAKTPDRRTRTKPARDAFLARFERVVDPDGVLPEAERRKRAESAKAAYMTRLAYASHKARRQRKKS